MMPLSQFLLISLRHSGERGASEDILLAHARTNGYPNATMPDLQRALRDLADRSQVNAFEQAIVGKRWRITALAIDQLREAGL